MSKRSSGTIQLNGEKIHMDIVLYFDIVDIKKSLYIKRPLKYKV